MTFLGSNNDSNNNIMIYVGKHPYLLGDIYRVISEWNNYVSNLFSNGSAKTSICVYMCVYIYIYIYIERERERERARERERNVMPQEMSIY